MMKKITLTVFTTLVLTLAACSAASNGTGPAAVTQNGTLTGELPAATQLIVGTLKLDETENAVTAEQAAELLPLWQTLQVLSESDTAAQQEMEALIAQIQETMTADQMQAITDMSLTRADMMSIMQEQGLAMRVPTGTQNTSSQSERTSGGSGEFARGGGPPPDGGFPGGGPGFAGQGQNLSEDQIATAQAARQENNGSAVPPMLINALVEYLQKKQVPG
jgi:hypothetical protein